MAARHGLLHTTDILKAAQILMDRNILNIKLQQKVPCSKIIKRMKLTDIKKSFLNKNGDGLGIQ